MYTLDIPSNTQFFFPRYWTSNSTQNIVLVKLAAHSDQAKYSAEVPKHVETIDGHEELYGNS